MASSFTLSELDVILNSHSPLDNPRLGTSSRGNDHRDPFPLFQGDSFCYFEADLVHEENPGHTDCGTLLQRSSRQSILVTTMWVSVRFVLGGEREAPTNTGLSEALTTNQSVLSLLVRGPGVQTTEFLVLFLNSLTCMPAVKFP